MSKMHANEADTGLELVSQLLAEQFPQWANLPLTAVPSAGTDNALYRLGDKRVIRLPRIGWAIGQVEKEHRWLPWLAPQLPFTIPTPIAQGKPGHGYPWAWSIYHWLDGENLTLDQLTDPHQTAIDLAHFLKQLQAIDTANGLPAAQFNRRGLPLITRDKATRQAIAAMGDMIDQTKATAIWNQALEAGGWTAEPVWFHGDLLPGNLLFRDGRLSAVIDFGGLAVGDPACDLMIAWALLAGESRALFRQEIAVDEATWLRGRGHALSQAVMFIPYYLHTNPLGVARAQHMLGQLLTTYTLT